MEDILGFGKFEVKSVPVNCKMHAQGEMEILLCKHTECWMWSFCPANWF